MTWSGARLVMLAAGGTGGHLFPAQALAEELSARGFCIHLMTDERVRDFGKAFPAEATHIVPAATLSLSDLVRVPGNLFTLYRGYRTARAVMARAAPVAVAGFGGYPSLAPLFAASKLGIPTLVHEQNSVLGRANRLLSRHVTVVATSFEQVSGLPAQALAKVTMTGNPVRGVVKAVAGAAYPEIKAGGPISLLIFGGSQGARIFADLIPPTILAMPEALRRRLVVTQQCRGEDLARTSSAYAAAGVRVDLQPFFMDMPQRMAACHLAICRSGASTIAELGVIGRPAILVPLPHAIDNDQLRNAESFASAGAGWVHPQAQLAANSFAAVLTRLLANEAGLKEAAQAALRHGRPEAAARLADAVEKIMAGKSPAAQEI